MKFLSICCCFLLFLFTQSVSSQNAMVPPRGWNSYDSFSWIISEEEFLQNADLISKLLLVDGYEYAVVDCCWYRSLNGGNATIGNDNVDEWGRMLPDPVRWPSSNDGKGFKEVADKVHSMDLKFGIHLMAGISTHAMDMNTPILDTRTGNPYRESGRNWHAGDIGIRSKACSWMPNSFMAINTTLGAGRAFLRSIYELYSSWGVDFVKLDCVFGDNLDLGEITTVSEILKDLDHPMVFSVSPGVSATPDMAKKINGLVNMYRITRDDWDQWHYVVEHFDVTRDFASAGLIGVGGLKGNSWPDLDMLPFGWLTDPDVNVGPHRFCRLTQTEQISQMTLWSMAKSPLIYGGDMRKPDVWTINLITNPTLLEINSYSSNNKEFPYVASMGNSRKEEQNLDQTLSLSLTSCTDPRAIGWYSESPKQDLEIICYKQNTGSKGGQAPFCAQKKEPGMQTNEKESMNKGKYHLVDINRKHLCLDAYLARENNALKVNIEGSFSPCRLEASQMWALKRNGTLMNGDSNLCAKVESVLAQGSNPGIRSWIATGRKGEVYVAFFNLNEENTKITMKTSDLAAVLPGAKLTNCQGKDMWNEENIVVNDTFLAEVGAHGCSLFVLNCT